MRWRCVGRVSAALGLVLAATTPLAAQSTMRPPAALRTEYVILAISDGVRWQEVVRGADAALMGKAGKVSDTAAVRRDFWRDTPQARRETLFPFLWGTMATQGQLFGDSVSGSVARITNTKKFSYPGYSETFTGFAVESKLARAADLNKRYRITSTPTVVVNGKFVTDAGMAGSEDKLFEVINALAARDKPAS